MCVCVCVFSHVPYSVTPCDPSGSSVHGITQARILEWAAISYSRAFPNPGIKPASHDLASRFFTTAPPKFSSVQSLSHVWISLRPHESQHARPPCPSPTPRDHPNPCPLSQRCHPVISSSVVPFSSCPQSFPASGSFPVSQLFVWGGQSIGVSASASVLPMNTQTPKKPLLVFQIWPSK